MPYADRSPTLKRELERIAAERLEAERQVQRIYRRELILVCVQCLASSAIGAVVMGFGMHADTRDVGEIFWWGGMLLGYTGVAVSLIRGYLRGEERGDW